MGKLLTDETGRLIVNAINNNEITQQRIAEINASAETAKQSALNEIQAVKDTIPADYSSLNADVLDNTEAITQNTADIDELKVKSLPSINLTLPDSITKISDLAFCANQSLVSVTIHNRITSIGVGAFKLCKNLKSATIGSGVKSIGDNMFQGCSSLTSITIPDSVTSIGDSAFRSCTSLTSVTIPNSVTSIGGWAFNNCTSLASVTIPNSVTSIGVGAFAGDKSLTSITIPNSVTSIGNSVFLEARNIVNITIENGFNANGLDLSHCEKCTADTILSWLIALADRTGQEQYTLIIGAKNKEKLTTEQLAIATNKNWNIA